MLNDGTLTFAAAEGYDETIICAANVHPSSSGTYIYNVEIGVSTVLELPNREATLRCWPNPFNPATELSFRLPTAGYARLLVHDSRGRLVAVLQEGRMPAGQHHFTWNAQGLPSGMYFASVEIDGVLATVIKVSLIK